jgi:hypothetical protein
MADESEAFIRVRAPIIAGVHSRELLETRKSYSLIRHRDKVLVWGRAEQAHDVSFALKAREPK